MKLTRNWVIGLAAMLAWVNLAASKEEPKRPAAPKLPAGVKLLRDLHYVEGGHERNRLDLYLPEKVESRLPMVVWIHGGAWLGGSKEGCPAVFLVAKGCAVASINYSLSQHAVFPAQIEDCKAAIRWLRANAAKYHLDSDHIGVWGASAGGHLVAMLGTTGNVKDFPVLTGWLAANDKSLELFVTATKRPRRYDPLIPENGCMIGALLPAVGHYREAARALMARAMLHANEGKVDEAWDDLLACHRLARLTGQGATLVDELVAIAVDGLACAGDQGLLQTRLAPAQIARMRADLDKLLPMPKTVDKINVGERFMFLDSVGMVAREGFHNMSDLSGGGNPKGAMESLMDAAARASVDWDHVLRLGNSWYDRMDNAYGKPTRAERQAAFRKIDEDIRKLAVSAKDWKSLGLAMLVDRRSAISERIGQMFVALLLPAVSTVSNAEDRGAMKFDLTKLAFALAAYRADRGAYPARLADPVPKYVAKVPSDIFSAAELHYRLEDGGYLLYSVGGNGKDDGGKGMDDRKEGEDWDDIAVRIPAATVRKQ